MGARRGRHNTLVPSWDHFEKVKKKRFQKNRDQILRLDFQRRIFRTKSVYLGYRLTLSRKSSILRPKKNVTEVFEVAGRTQRVLGVRSRAAARFPPPELLETRSLYSERVKPILEPPPGCRKKKRHKNVVTAPQLTASSELST